MSDVIARTADRNLVHRGFYAYLAVSAAMIATSAYTGHRATTMSGDDHYMLTTTSILVPEEIEASNDTDAAFDAAFSEAGESIAMSVEKPVFVLGFLDATAPVVVLGGLAIGLAAWISRRRRGRQGGKGFAVVD